MSQDEYVPLITRLGNDREAFEYIYGLINDVLGGEMQEKSQNRNSFSEKWKLSQSLVPNARASGKVGRMGVTIFKKFQKYF